MTWRQSVWTAIQRLPSSDGFSRQQLIAAELPVIIAEIGSEGATPEQTLSRVLQELRNDGLLIFDGNGRYRVAKGLDIQSVEEAVATEAWRLQKARIGQSPFRKALLERWGGACPLTGIKEPELLRASHIVPWNRCETEAERLNPENGLLLSALWDAAFDRGLVTFNDDGEAVPQPALSLTSFAAVGAGRKLRLSKLTVGNVQRLRRHRLKWMGGPLATY